MPHNENGNSISLRNTLGSGLTISAVPISKEADRTDHSENGNKWDDKDSGSEAGIDCDMVNPDDCTDSVSVLFQVELIAWFLICFIFIILPIIARRRNRELGSANRSV